MPHRNRPCPTPDYPASPSPACLGRRCQAPGQPTHLAEAGSHSADGQYLDIVQHELRTPLTVVTGYIDALLEGLLGDTTPDQADALRRVQTAARTLESHLQALLAGNPISPQLDTETPTAMPDQRTTPAGSPPRWEAAHRPERRQGSSRSPGGESSKDHGLPTPVRTRRLRGKFAIKEWDAFNGR